MAGQTLNKNSHFKHMKVLKVTEKVRKVKLGKVIN